MHNKFSIFNFQFSIKSFVLVFTFLMLFLASFNTVFALDRNTATQAYSAELVALGMEQVAANAKAENDIENLVTSMTNSQAEAGFSFDAVEDRVNNLLRTDLRRDAARDALEEAETLKDYFHSLNPENFIFLQESVSGSLPEVYPEQDFAFAEEQYETALGEVNRILIAPTRPGVVPEGDIVSDFIPQIIRQLFRFAWVAIFISLTVSGVMFVMVKDNEERITKAKAMLTFSLIGFVVISLAFAIVKAVTDIDFFRFI